MSPHFVSRCALVLAAAVLLLSIGCRRSNAPRGSGSAAVPVHVAVAARRTVPRLQSAVGTVQPLHTVAIKSQIDGIIAQVHFRDGDSVAAGTRLLSIDARPYRESLKMAQAELAQARAAAAKAEADLDRYRSLDGQGAVSREALAQYSTAATSAAAAVAAREAAVARAELNLEYTEITAPIAGRTSRLALKEGSLVKANDSGPGLLTINELAPIGVDFAVPESTLAPIRAAVAAGPVAVTVRLQDGSGRSADGTLDYLDNAVDTTTGTIALRAVFPNRDEILWPGQFVTVALRLGELPDAVVVPASAVQTGQQGSQIFVVKSDQTVELRPAKTGLTDGDDVVILEGVKAGETVVTDGQLRLLPGTRITARATATATP